MHYLLFPFALLLSGATLANEHRSHEHDSLDAHVHGEAQLDVALEGKLLELQLHSPAMNLAGFERAPANAREQARLNTVRDFLTQPEKVFMLAPEAGCALEREAVSSELFGVAAGDEDHLALHDEASEAEPADDHHTSMPITSSPAPSPRPCARLTCVICSVSTRDCMNWTFN